MMHRGVGRASRLVSAVCAAALAALLAAPHAASAKDLLMRIGGLTVPLGGVLRGDAITIGGTARIDGTVDGDAVAVGGTVDVAGHVTGSVRAEGGRVILHSTAFVDGDVSAFGGRVTWDVTGKTSPTN